MNNERKPITRIVKGTEPWIPDQAQVMVKAWDDKKNDFIDGWLVVDAKGIGEYRYGVILDGIIGFYKHIEPLYEPATKKTRHMTPLEAYVFLLDCGYVFKHRNWEYTWNGHGAWSDSYKPQDCLYAVPKEPLEWHEFPEVEAE